MTEKIILALIFGGLGLGFIGGLLQKIVWDWLKSRKNDDSEYRDGETFYRHCEGHIDFMARIEALEKDNIKRQKEYIELSTSFRNHAKQVEKILDQGQNTFKVIEKKIARMDTSIATIATIIKERTK